MSKLFMLICLLIYFLDRPSGVRSKLFKLVINFRSLYDFLKWTHKLTFQTNLREQHKTGEPSA